MPLLYKCPSNIPTYVTWVYLLSNLNNSKRLCGLCFWGWGTLKSIGFIHSYRVTVVL